jgi:hypothetical protein
VLPPSLHLAVVTLVRVLCVGGCWSDLGHDTNYEGGDIGGQIERIKADDGTRPIFLSSWRYTRTALCGLGGMGGKAAAGEGGRSCSSVVVARSSRHAQQALAQPRGSGLARLPRLLVDGEAAAAFAEAAPHELRQLRLHQLVEQPALLGLWPAHAAAAAGARRVPLRQNLRRQIAGRLRATAPAREKRAAERRAPHRPRDSESGGEKQRREATLTHPADASRTNLAAALWSAFEVAAFQNH